jgi:hypothetical protein
MTERKDPQSSAPSGGGVLPPRAERRPEMIRRRREERRQRAEKDRREWLLTRIGAAVVGLLLVAGIGYVVFAGLRERRASQPPDGVATIDGLSRDHVDGAVAYAQTPPVGGEHAPVWQNCRVYDAPVVNERAVHSLEHGAVWITWRPDLPDDQVDAVRRLADGQGFVLASPFPGLPSPVVASAWGRQLPLESADDPRLAQFVRAFAQGPQTPEPGAPCSGGASEAA